MSTSFIYMFIYTYLYLYIYPSLLSILLWMFEFHWTLDRGIVLWTVDIFENELFFHVVHEKNELWKNDLDRSEK